VASYLAANNAWPKASVQWSGMLRPDITIINSAGALSQVGVYSPNMFSYRPGFKEQCVIRSITYDVRNSKMSMTLKALDPY
jgi:hypothetical protein